MIDLAPHLQSWLKDRSAYVKAVFSESLLQVVEPSARFLQSLSDRSRHYLCEVGLPSVDKTLEESLGLNFRLLRELRPLEAIVHVHQGLPLAWRDCICINDLYGVYACINAKEGGIVAMLDSNKLFEKQFVNSNVESFGLFIAMYTADLRLRSTAPLEECDRFLPQLEFCMREIDRQALESDKHYWPNILEEIGYGML